MHSRLQLGRSVSFVIGALLLNGCGSGASTTPVAPSTSVALQISLPQSAADLTAQPALPLFHVAPVLLPEPADEAGADPAQQLAGPHTEHVDILLSNVSTRRLTVQRLHFAARQGVASFEETAADSNPTPMATGSVVSTYTPAQIRAAYGLPAVPAAGTQLTALQSAQLGAGQTIYIVDAQHDPNVAAELATFNQKFALPTCTTSAIPVGSSLPLPALPAGSGCTLSVVYATSAGVMTSSAPAYDAGWATEIALDVQWSHAIAPLARIILIEAPDSSVGTLSAAVRLANTMGPGIVSMSFGAPEGSWGSQFETAFAGAKMTYVAAAGDAGAAVEWPAVSQRVLAVGGTSLTYSGSGTRSETVWSGTGGGVSQFTSTPTYQTSAVPGMGNPGHRAVTDVSLNADPATGQYVAVIQQGAATASWLSAGGTSVSSPEWAALIAVANALRAQATLPVLGVPHAQLYNSISTVPSSYANAFGDVTQGSNGTCSTCSAKTGYDLPTGLGTPNASALFNLLGANSSGSSGGSAGSPPTPQPPVVQSASVSGTAGTALTFAISVSDANPFTLTLKGAPTGLTVTSAGVASWPNPVAGKYVVTVTAVDSKTGLSAQGTVNITIAAPQPPVVATATISGRSGSPLTFTVAVTSANPVTYMLSGAPIGMSINSSGVVTWSNPAAGNYSVTVIATDSKTGLSGKGLINIGILVSGPVITASAMTGVAGKPLSGTIGFSDATSNSLAITITGIPAGMKLSASGTTVNLSWPSPVKGSYTLSVTAKDGNGQSASRQVSVSISAK